jgi:hypothetical protein
LLKQRAREGVVAKDANQAVGKEHQRVANADVSLVLLRFSSIGDDGNYQLVDKEPRTKHSSKVWKPGVEHY